MLKKIYKILISACAIILMGISAQAETVSQKEASKIAQTFFNAAYGEVVAPPKLHWNGRQLTTNRLFVPFYIYNHPKGGYVIVSAENKAFPILAYSTSRNFDYEKMSDEVRKTLKDYAEEIEMVRYDSRYPARAVEAWRDMRTTIHNVLTRPYITPEYQKLTVESREDLETLDRLNASIFMPMAVENPVRNPYSADGITVDDIVNDDAEEVPFSFYESFLREIEQEQAERQAMLDEILNPSEPVIEYVGGGHLQIAYPADVTHINVYSLDGSRVLSRKSKGASSVSLDLSALPVGYYAVMALLDDGRIFGLKVAR